MSAKIQAALAYLAANPTASRHQASKAVGLDSSQLYKYLKLMESKQAGKCQQCGAKLKAKRPPAS